MFNANAIAPVGLFAEGETAVPFETKADDKYGPASVNVREYAVVKSSGYLQRVGIGSGIGSQLAAAVAYAQETGAAVPTFVSRFIGDEQWFMLAPVNVIPDTLEGLTE